MSPEGVGERMIDQKSLVESIVIMVFSAAMYAVTYAFDEVPPILALCVQPTVFPRAILILMFLLALLQAVKAVRLSPADISKLKPYKPVPGIVYVTSIFLIGFFILMPVIGTFPTLIVFCPALALIWGRKALAPDGAQLLGIRGFHLRAICRDP
ncbi:MAG: tripartite tricarboxylate transporter TctB family protein [Albidovulum sp.]|nr:tripartite tricarboxylate transporter TctB family protein [Albidovulum sp.]